MTKAASAVAVAAAAIRAMLTELDSDERATVLAHAMSEAGDALVKALDRVAFGSDETHAIRSACAKKFDLTPADLSATDIRTLIAALNGHALGEGLSDRECEELLCIAGEERRPDGVAQAIAEMRAGDVDAAERTLDETFPGASRNAVSHAGRCRMLFDLGGGR